MADEFRCQVCGEQFDTQEELDQHHREQHPELLGQPYQCQTCGQGFGTEDQLTAHERARHTQAA